MTTSNLGVPTLAAAQANKIVFINEAFEAFDQATQGVAAHDVEDGDLTLTVEQLSAAYLLDFTGAPGADRIVTLPSNIRRAFGARNSTGRALTLQLAAVADSGVELADGEVAAFVSTSRELLRMTGAAGGGGGITVEDEGTALATAATRLNFTGAGVTAAGTGAEKTITVPGGGTGITPAQAARLLPALPDAGSRDNKVPKFDGDILGWEEDAAGAGGADLIIADESTDLATAATRIQFQGAGVTAANDGTTPATKIVTIPGATGTGGYTPAVSDKTADYTIVNGDQGNTIRATGSTALKFNLPDVATPIAAGWWVRVANASSAALTLDGNGADTIDGAATLEVAAGDVVTLQVVGATAWMVLTTTAGGAATGAAAGGGRSFDKVSTDTAITSSAWAEVPVAGMDLDDLAFIWLDGGAPRFRPIVRWGDIPESDSTNITFTDGSAYPAPSLASDNLAGGTVFLVWLRRRTNGTHLGVRFNFSENAGKFNVVRIGQGGAGASDGSTELYADSADHRWDHDAFRSVTLAKAPTAGRTLRIRITDAGQRVAASIRMGSDEFLEIPLFDSSVDGFRANEPSPGNSVWLGLTPRFYDDGQRYFSFTIGAGEGSQLNFVIVRRVSDTEMGLLFTNDGLDFAGRVTIEEF